MGLIGHLDVQRVAVGVAVHGDRRIAELSNGSDDPDRDLAAVRDQDPRFRHALRSVMLCSIGPSGPMVRATGTHRTIGYPRTGVKRLVLSEDALVRALERVGLRAPVRFDEVTASTQ